MELKADEEGTGAADGARSAGGSKLGLTTIDAEEWPNGVSSLHTTARYSLTWS